MQKQQRTMIPVCHVGDTVGYRWRNQIKTGRIQRLVPVWSTGRGALVPCVAIEYRYTGLEGPMIGVRTVPVKAICKVFRQEKAVAQ